MDLPLSILLIYLSPLLSIQLVAFLNRKKLSNEEYVDINTYSTIPILNIIFLIGIIVVQIDKTISKDNK